MKILHVYKDYHPIFGGIENHIRTLAEAQVRLGHEVTVLVTNRAGAHTVEESLNGVRVIRAGRLVTLASTPLSTAMVTILKSLRPDITHLQAPYPVGEIAQWLAGKGRPYVMSYQADINRLAQRVIMQVYRPVFDAVIKRASAVLATSPAFAAGSPYLRQVGDRLVIVPLGIDTTRFAVPAGKPPAPAPTLLFVGQLRHYKGVEDLLRALARLPVPGRPKLLLAGNGPLRGEWMALCEALGLGQHVSFLGNVPDADLPSLYQSADVFVLPSTSRSESFGLVLVEAMASGLPCVTTEIGSGNSYVVQRDVTGLVVPPRDPAALAEAITRLCGDPALRQQMGAAGRERALLEFTQERMVGRVEAVYQSVLSRT